ncbi:Ig-like domain-containing protein [Ligaoa zhengdingensis]|uniref:Ig-like domain-containing protein n=4 Tax=Ligaoa zhengdingensis TaxID=2763658 RepID=UPI0031BBC235
MAKNIFHNRKVIAIILSSIFLVITLTTGVLAALNTEARMSRSSEEDSSASESLPGEDSGEESSQEDSAVVAPVTFQRPRELRAVFLVPGTDFLRNGTDEASVKAEVDKSLADAVSFTANAVVVDTMYDGEPIYKADGFDALGYLCEKAQEQNLLAYATLDLLHGQDDIDNALLDDLADEAADLAGSYPLAGVFVQNFCMDQSSGGFAAYQASGTGMGYANYMKSMTAAAFRAVSEAIRDASPETQVGIYTPPVWANQSSDEAGSNTNSGYQTLIDGNADTKAWVEDGLADFVAVQATGYTSDPNLRFSNVVSWWGELCDANDIPVYPVHMATKVGDNWDGEELAQQYLEARDIAGFGGSVFDSLAAITANVQGSTDRLHRAMNDEIDLSYILEKLELTQPSQMNITTTNPTYTIMGASDPDFPVLMNGEEIERNESGYINITVELEEGPNTFNFKHKEQDLTYTITRKTEVLKSITPAEASTLEGGMILTVTAMAYPDASVTAKINGSTINLTKAESSEEDDQTEKNESYVKYIGTYKTPVVKGNTNIGSVVVTASAGGASRTLQSGAITLTPPIEIGDGELIEVKVPSAETFPDDTLNDISNSAYYPICQGARDYTVSNKLAYTDSTGTHYYYLLESGRRVYADDIRVIQGGDDLYNNKVTSASIKSSGGYTYVTFATNKPVSYTFGHSNGKITIKFHYTDSVPGSAKISSNPMFASMSGSGSTVTLNLKNSNGFIGYTAAYEGNDLVFKFKNSPGGLSGARIWIDPGHSADSVGASGSYPGQHEYHINLAIAKKLKSILEDNGATVKMLNNSSFVSLESRMQQAKDFNPHVLVSVHANSAGSNSSARGSEAYYFYGFSSGLASRVSSGMANALNTTNRGGKKGLYYMTRTSEFATTLSETGFLTNNTEYEKMLSSSYQRSVAAGIANAINDYLAAAAGSSSGGGVDWDDEEEEEDEETVPVTGVTLDRSTLSLAVGESATLEATVKPNDATDDKVTWTSSKESVATVSASGKVTAKAVGTATITATTRDGKKTASCVVTVTAEATGSKLTSVKIDDYDDELVVGDNYSFEATVTPGDASNVSLTWSVDDTNVATINKSSGVLTAKKAGKVKVTVTAKDTSTTKTDTVTINVVETPSATSVRLDSSSLTIKAGSSEQLIATIRPSGATAKVTWSMKKGGLGISVDSDGIVSVDEGIKSDVTDIVVATIKTADGNKTAECVVTGKADTGGGSSSSAPESGPEEVRLDTDELDLVVGENGVLTAELLPDGTGGSVTWTSSDDKIASVSGGKVTARAPGKVTIKATAKNGKSASCTVTVEEE